MNTFNPTDKFYRILSTIVTFIVVPVALRYAFNNSSQDIIRSFLYTIGALFLINGSLKQHSFRLAISDSNIIFKYYNLLSALTFKSQSFPLKTNLIRKILCRYNINESLTMVTLFSEEHSDKRAIVFNGFSYKAIKDILEHLPPDCVIEMYPYLEQQLRKIGYTGRIDIVRP